MKKHNKILFIIALLLFIPLTTNAESVSNVSSGFNYYKNYNGDTIVETFNGTLPVYPFSRTENTDIYIDQTALEFVIPNNSSTLSGKSYTATAVYTYKLDGLKSCGNDLSGYIVPYNNSSAVINSSSSVEVLERYGDCDGYKVRITYSGTLSSTFDLEKFTVGLVGQLGSCGVDGTGGYQCSSTVYSQLSLLDFTVTVSQDPTQDLLNNLNQSQIETNNKLDEVNETNKGIWESIKELPSKFLEMLKSLFIPEDMSFLDEFKESLETKLGFIAEVPIAILDFLFGLATASWEEFNSITFPTIEIFGVYFWPEMEISLAPAKEIFEPFKYFTDMSCVLICANTLKKWYDNFASGGGS